ncbi:MULTISPECIES: shikimate dehydrogenase [Prochlorococcus]|uniref:Shikimate dehydrogenase (NADP(+)) n=1 Tax=Prochlorococcus marinus (strain SARG / CCMP1375 / SS120) TaxID=167539 RepID=Q7V9G1_PROMA|nr:MULTISPECIES: shikimate dehydrogenase [Prochlorococcus]AAQ00916.1 Shikimate 5-dehydrogenase [Prochlorococcus marinus subsp. marinus str. CCMP1375]KGG10589.1 Shikimate 5-dehydrogenase I alpha [Prochlorococcus marinus str. LG]KGG19945.1 Shikimate 5-dehydrogenase I alpha [Prochlorococcus marinus str. SS2]KGG23835.1 Shikimate 5-dehydrogenase I alpha [Prochlorococcus marinus str. SS35]KGG31905.1 Shikimate 5-dehydrogenase I alpha [Prochlorococcus marinus str. SS51]
MEQLIKGPINGETSLVGVLGCPVKHSLSPIIQNAALKELGLNWCYLAIPCKPQNFELVIKALRTINCKGLNITIPHKNIALDVCDELSSIAKQIGAVNTLIPSKRKNWFGTNTDIEGFRSSLLERKINYEGKNAIIIGTGGSAKAVLHGLDTLKFGKITIVSRTKNSLKKFLINNNNLCTEIDGLIQEDLTLEEYIKAANLIVNATPIGMENKANSKSSSEIPLGKSIWENLQPGSTLYDLIYTPKPTKWLQLSRKYSCHQIDGLEMLVQQGASSLRLWSGIEEIPIDIMRKAGQKALLN